MSNDPDQARYSRIEIARHGLNFSIAHFTIFSASERENLHGHNFEVECRVEAPVHQDGLTFDYAVIKETLRAICDELDEHVALPAWSPHLEIVDEGEYTVALFAGERIPFLARDVLVLPVANITVEEMSWYLLERALATPEMKGRDIRAMTVKVSCTPGQTGTAFWQAT